MGYYIPGPAKGKAAMLVAEHGAHLLPNGAAAMDAFKAGKGVVCVVDNGPFEAAGFMYSENEFKQWLAPDARPRVWLAMGLTTAHHLSGFDPALDG